MPCIQVALRVLIAHHLDAAIDNLYSRVIQKECGVGIVNMENVVIAFFLFDFRLEFLEKMLAQRDVRIKVIHFLYRCSRFWTVGLIGHGRLLSRVFVCVVYFFSVELSGSIIRPGIHPVNDS